ncbi:unnamed protein product [Vicia faba]|uniref:Uncharacterized protein n=1 Tax=Vicia faba TaxID=3906 RepID=A0AAV0YHL8_VICFA|nr:unnamed protein product [Vicia faba]
MKHHHHLHSYKTNKTRKENERESGLSELSQRREGGARWQTASLAAAPAHEIDLQNKVLENSSLNIYQSIKNGFRLTEVVWMISDGFQRRSSGGQKEISRNKCFPER